MDSSIGSPTADSYVDTVYADSFAASSIGYSTIWPIDIATKQSALINATRLLDASYSWLGSKVSDTQALDWPRSGVYDKNGLLISSTQLPKVLIDATCQLALNLLSSKGYAIPSQTADQIQVGPIRLRFDTSQTTSVFGSSIISALSALGSFSAPNNQAISMQKVLRS